jgi:hypothetical protein
MTSYRAPGVNPPARFAQPRAPPPSATRCALRAWNHNTTTT